MLEQFEALGFINERGGVEMNDRDGMLRALRGFKRGANVLVTVKVHRETRSSAQNRFYHGVVILRSLTTAATRPPRPRTRSRWSCCRVKSWT